MKKRHTEAVRAWAIQQIMPPIGRSMREVADELGITTEALRLWRKTFLGPLSPGPATTQRSALPARPRQVPSPDSLVGGGQRKQIRYTDAFRQWAVHQMMPPLNQPAVLLATLTGVTPATLRGWQHAARAEGKIMARNSKPAQRWSGGDKFRMLLETAALSDAEVSAYCRTKGIYREQLAQWRQACEMANDPASQTARTESRRIMKLERELAEARALLELRKKAEAIWGKSEEE